MDEKLPCPTCRTPVELAAELCLQCGARLLVDVVLVAPVADGRERYRLARTLSALPGAPPLGSIQSGLASAPATAGRGVTRVFAQAAVPILAEHGLRAAIDKHVEAKPPLRIEPRTALAGLGAAALVALAYVGLRSVTARPVPAAAAAPIAEPAAAPEAALPRTARATSSRELARRALASAAALRCLNSGGSGFFVAADLVVTNAHVLCPPGEQLQVSTSDGRALAGEVLRRDHAMDLALVRVAGAGAAPLPLGDVGEAGVGDRVTIVGSPVGLDFTVQEGSLSSLQRSAGGTAYLQLDAKVSPGNSGGPVIDGQGRVIGIVSMKVTGEGVEGIGLAIPINYVYGPALAYVGPPSAAAASSDGFRQMVARAQESPDSGLRAAHSESPTGPAYDGRPLLVAGRVDQYGNLVVRVVRITEYQPAFEEIAVTVWNGLDPFCTIKGDIASWQQVDAAVAGSGPGIDRRVAAGLRSLAGSRPVFVGESPLRWDLCDRTKMQRGVSIQLQGASEVASRLEVR